ncbi:MAG: tetratricopeptide repeat protein, partial [Planctomycetota bacterium]
MQAKQFWPPTKHKLLYGNLIVYGVTAVLLLLFSQELIWAQKTFRGLLSGNIPPSADKFLIQDAKEYLKAGKNAKSAQNLLERALQIEPYSEALILLGNCHLMQGNEDEMLACYEQYRSINPSSIGVYMNMIEILARKHDDQTINQLLTEGIKHFQRRAELYQPHYDPNVPKPFNIKALTIYNRS